MGLLTAIVTATNAITQATKVVRSYIKGKNDSTNSHLASGDKPGSVPNPDEYVGNWGIKDGVYWYGTKVRDGDTGDGNSYSPPPPPAPPSTITQQKKSTVTKFEYVYGIKDLYMYGKETAPSSVYVSKPVTIEAGTIAQVMLVAAEEHPIFTPEFLGGTPATRCTSVEYYITHHQNPDKDQWYPILPEGEITVTNELLFLVNGEGTLRFPALVSKPIHVYRDNVKLYNDEWEIGPLGLSVRIRDPKPGVDYTIDYTPDETKANPYVIDFQQKGIVPVKYIGSDGREGEVFNGANHNCSVKLKYTPYIDYSRINNVSNYDPNTSEYVPIKVYLEETDLAINKQVIPTISPYGDNISSSVYTRNITDYVNRTQPILKTHNPKINASTGAPYNPGFEFYQSGSFIYFTETFKNANSIENREINHCNAKIRVVYEYQVASIRVKIILRRTGKAHYSSLSPVVHKYTLKILTLGGLL